MLQDSWKIMVLLYIIVINVLAWVLYGIDKRKAVKGKWRISEKMLLGMAALGGAFGAWIGMYMFHHKTKHWKFKIAVPLFAIIYFSLFTFVLFLR